MNEQKHTPGPWSATKQSKTSYRIDTAGEQFPEWKGLAHVFIAVGTEDESKANASLIAAAPDMLAALKECQGVLETAGRYFPKSIQNSDKFHLVNILENSVKKTIAQAEGK